MRISDWSPDGCSSDLHSWPLYGRARFFELGQLHRCETLDPIPDVVDVAARLAPARAPIGQWECDLTDNNRLSWSDAVYDIFGIPRGAAVTRAETVALYAEGSRAAMEKLRAYATRSEEHTSELQSLMRHAYAGFC